MSNKKQKLLVLIWLFTHIVITLPFQYLFGLFSWLVEKQVFRKVKINFLMVG